VCFREFYAIFGALLNFFRSFLKKSFFFFLFVLATFRLRRMFQCTNQNSSTLIHQIGIVDLQPFGVTLSVLDDECRSSRFIEYPLASVSDITIVLSDFDFGNYHLPHRVKKVIVVVLPASGASALALSLFHVVFLLWESICPQEANTPLSTFFRSLLWTWMDLTVLGNRLRLAFNFA
jgi:hypothetical protein